MTPIQWSGYLMNKAYLLISILIFSKFSFGLKVEMKFAYHQHIRSAEQCLMAGDDDKGFDFYEKALDDTSVFFLYDFLAPLQLLVRDHNDSVFSNFLMKMPLDQSDQNKLFEWLEKHQAEHWDESWKNLMNNTNYKVNQNDSELASLIDSIYQKDQEDRTKVYDKWPLFRIKAMREWDENSHERIALFMQYIRTNGFPNDLVMGLDARFMYHRKMLTVFYHYPQTYHKYKSDLNSWLSAGQLHPRHYAWIVDFSFKHADKMSRQKKSFYQYGMFVLAYSKFGANLDNEEIIQSVNQNRKKIQLPSIEHQCSWSIFLKKNDLKCFDFI